MIYSSFSSYFKICLIKSSSTVNSLYIWKSQVFYQTSSVSSLLSDKERWREKLSKALFSASTTLKD